MKQRKMKDRLFIGFSVISKIHMPKMKFDEDTEIHIFERDQLEKLDKYFSGTNLELAYLLGRYCGLRINECFGLTWNAAYDRFGWRLLLVLFRCGSGFGFGFGGAFGSRSDFERHALVIP